MIVPAVPLSFPSQRTPSPIARGHRGGEKADERHVVERQDLLRRPVVAEVADAERLARPIPRRSHRSAMSEDVADLVTLPDHDE